MGPGDSNPRVLSFVCIFPISLPVKAMTISGSESPASNVSFHPLILLIISIQSILVDFPPNSP